MFDRKHVSITFVMGGRLVATVVWKLMSREPSPVLLSYRVSNTNSDSREFGVLPLKLRSEVNLITVDDRLAFFIRGH